MLRLPFAGVSGDGIIDLGIDGLAMICRASAVTFSLRTPAEQEALVAGFARWLNSLDQAAQILVRAEPIDLTPSIDALLDAAPALPHPALEAAARGHAAFLADLGARRDLLRREVLVVLRQPSGTDAPARLHRRAAEATRALGAARAALKSEPVQAVPMTLRDSHTVTNKKLGQGEGYLYSHEFPEAISGQDYLEKFLQLYEPGPHPAGAEAAIAERLERWRKLKSARRGE